VRGKVKQEGNTYPALFYQLACTALVLSEKWLPHSSRQADHIFQPLVAAGLARLYSGGLLAGSRRNRITLLREQSRRR
jgi:hypothetical protein